MKVCIDAGHCKLTPGKRAFDGSFLEWQFNLDVANRVKEHLDRHGVNSYVQYIENSNPSTELNARITAINKDKPTLVVSIHANAFGADWNDANGWEIFCNTPLNLSSKGTLLAKVMQKYSKALGLKDRGVKDAHGVAGIVTKTLAPAVLIEHGFYTNQTELAKLKDSNFRELCAICDAKGILEYLGIEWKEQEEEEMKRYNKVEELPKGLQKEVQKLIDAGALRGDEKGNLNITEDMVRCMIINKRYADSKGAKFNA